MVSLEKTELSPSVGYKLFKQPSKKLDTQNNSDSSFIATKEDYTTR